MVAYLSPCLCELAAALFYGTSLDELPFLMLWEVATWLVETLPSLVFKWDWMLALPKMTAWFLGFPAD